MPKDPCWAGDNLGSGQVSAAGQQRLALASAGSTRAEPVVSSRPDTWEAGAAKIWGQLISVGEE